VASIGGVQSVAPCLDCRLEFWWWLL